MLRIDLDELLENLSRTAKLLFRGQALGVVKELGHAAVLEVFAYSTQIGSEVLGGGIPLFRIFGEGAVQDRVECGRIVGEMCFQWRMRLVDELLQHRNIFAGKGQLSRQQEVKHHAG